MHHQLQISPTKKMSFESNDPADVIDAQDARLEIYIRMNDDPDKDYCFSVGINDEFSSLINIFQVLKLSLRPSIFYKQIPKSFKVSSDPGLLTDNGGLLFSDYAAKSTFEVKLTDKISDFAWPGQLILPVWEKDTLKQTSVVLFLLFWLYTDLPDYYSPTPGICLTNQVSKLVSLVLKQFGVNDVADNILKEIEPNQATYAVQIIFFVIHLIKITFIYLSLWSGLFNPYSLNPYKIHTVNKTEKLNDKKRDELISIGWTGSRRANIDEYREYFKECEIKRAGGIVKASKLGLFEKLKSPAIKLGKGEGFDSDLKSTKTVKDLEADPSKFFLTYDYFGEIGEVFENYLTNESTNVNQDIKNFRKYGPITSNDRIKKIIQARKTLVPESKDEIEKKND